MAKKMFRFEVTQEHIEEGIFNYADLRPRATSCAVALSVKDKLAFASIGKADWYIDGREVPIENIELTQWILNFDRYMESLYHNDWWAPEDYYRPQPAVFYVELPEDIEILTEA